jgi:hypothetical protein
VTLTPAIQAMLDQTSASWREILSLFNVDPEDPVVIRTVTAVLAVTEQLVVSGDSTALLCSLNGLAHLMAQRNQ